MAPSQSALRRFLLCSDGVHGVLTDDAIAEALRPALCAGQHCARVGGGRARRGKRRQLHRAGHGRGRAADRRLGRCWRARLQLPLIATPVAGETADGFALKALISEGRYSRLFGAVDEVEGGEAALKFPKPQVAAVATHHAAFVREAWVGAHVHSPWVAQVLQLPPRAARPASTPLCRSIRASFWSRRLVRRPAIGLEEGRAIGVGLARGVAALHRLGVIHRDIKPDNVILEGGGKLKLVDLGVVRVPGWGDFPPEDIPGTPAYMAPEMFKGEAGNEATDIYALGVTMFRAFTGEFPYGNPDATSPPRRDRPKDLAALRPDLPAWLGAVLGRAIAADFAERFRDAMEFAAEMEAGPPLAPALARRPQTLLERAPVRFWQGAAALLALALLLSAVAALG